MHTILPPFSTSPLPNILSYTSHLIRMWLLLCTVLGFDCPPEAAPQQLWEDLFFISVSDSLIKVKSLVAFAS